jgi:hypothetical protein
VLERNRDRSAIGSPAELRRASEDELAEHGDEIAAAVKRLLSLHREVRQSMLDKSCIARPPAVNAPIGCAGVHRLNKYRWSCEATVPERLQLQARSAAPSCCGTPPARLLIPAREVSGKLHVVAEN